MSVTNLIAENEKYIESNLKKFFINKDIDYKIVLDAMEYSLLVGGKRIRPLFLLEFMEICGGKKQDAVDFACAIEMIHTYSLIHDDLPCMDNDDLRRGKPSCHKAFSEDTALLAGDALLTYAFEITSQTASKDATRRLKAINTLAKYAGVNGMIGGQQIDLLNEGKEVPKELLLKTYSLKTGGLIKAAAEIGAILAGANEKEIKAAKKYAENIGLAFQIVDDILDVVADEKLLGKPVGSDKENLKFTYVSAFGLENAKQKVKELTNEAIEVLNIFSNDKTNLIEIAKYLIDRKY